MKTTFIKSGNLQLFATYNQTNKEEKRECVLFLHGFPDDHRSWEYQLEHFKDSYNVCAIDLRGISRSTAPSASDAYGIDDIMPDITAACKFLADDEQVHLVGHDWGAILAFQYISNPALSKRVKSYTAVSCPHVAIAFDNVRENLFNADLGQWATLSQQFLKSWYIMLFQLPFLPEFVIDNFAATGWQYAMQAGEIPATDPMHNYATQEIVDIMRNGVNLYRQLLRRGIPPLPPHIDLPVSIVIAERDLAIKPEAYDNHEQFFTHLHKYSMNTNHWAHRENPIEVNQIIENQIKSAA